MRILIAVDESPVSTRAAREASACSPEHSSSSSTSPPSPPPGSAVPGFGVVAALDIDPRSLDDDNANEADLMALAQAAGVSDPQVVVAAGDPVTHICAAAEEHDADVIAVESHDKTALRQLFNPSVAAGVVRDTFRPVLVVSGEPPSLA